jgi:hypothetical protein
VQGVQLGVSVESLDTIHNLQATAGSASGGTRGGDRRHFALQVSEPLLSLAIGVSSYDLCEMVGHCVE